MEAFLILVIFVLLAVIIRLRSRLEAEKEMHIPCERCGAQGNSSPFRGSPSLPTYYRKSLLLCSECREAQIEWLENLFMLQTERDFGFGRKEMLRAAEEVWGPQAIEVLAHLMLAEKDMDLASRVLEPGSFEKVRPWIEEQISGLKTATGSESGPPNSADRDHRSSGPSKGTFQPGQTVSVLSGPFTEFEVTVLEVNQADRTVLAEVELFGKIHEISLNLDQLEPVGSGLDDSNTSSQ